MKEANIEVFDFKGYAFKIVPTQRKDLLKYTLYFFDPFKLEWEKAFYCENMKQAKKLAYKFLRYYFLA